MKVGDGATKVGSLKFIESDGKLSTGRKISLGTAVDSTATEFDGSKDITIPVNSVSASYLSWGGRNLTDSISPIDAALSYIHSANRLQFAKPEGITVEYSTNSGSTWTDYGASNDQKIALVSGLSVNLFLGKHTSGTTATTDALRITLNASNCNVYTIGRTLLINFTTAGASGCKVKIETSTIGAPATFTDRGSYDINGWSGWNSYPINIGAFGGGATQTWQIANIRLTFTIGSAPSSDQRASVLNLLLFGDATWTTPSNMARTGHIYDWDVNQNAIFPAGITATSFNGNATSASSVSHSLTINGKTFNGSTAVDVGVIGAEYGGSGKTTLEKSAFAFLEALPEGAYTPSDNAQVVLRNPNTSASTAFPLTRLWNYIKDKGDSTYQPKGTYLTSIPIASSSTLGGVKIGSGLTVAADGTISAAAQYTLPTASSSVKGGIKVGTGLTMSSETLNHSNSITAKTAYGSTSTTASANGGSITVTDIKYDAQGHITGSTDRTITLSQTTYTLAGLMGSAAKGSATQPVYWNGSAWTNTTHTLGKSVPEDAKFTDTVYTLPTASSSTLGGIKLGTGLTAAEDGTVNVSVGGATITLKTWTDADVA